MKRHKTKSEVIVATLQRKILYDDNFLYDEISLSIAVVREVITGVDNEMLGNYARYLMNVFDRLYGDKSVYSVPDMLNVLREEVGIEPLENICLPLPPKSKAEMKAFTLSVKLNATHNFINTSVYCLWNSITDITKEQVVKVKVRLYEILTQYISNKITAEQLYTVLCGLRDDCQILMPNEAFENAKNRMVDKTPTDMIQ
jgi:hypothetical protein